MGTETWIISLPLSDSILYLKIIHPPKFPWRAKPNAARRKWIIKNRITGLRPSVINPIRPSGTFPVWEGEFDFRWDFSWLALISCSKKAVTKCRIISSPLFVILIYFSRIAIISWTPGEPLCSKCCKHFFPKALLRCLIAEYFSWQGVGPALYSGNVFHWVILDFLPFGKKSTE